MKIISIYPERVLKEIMDAQEKASTIYARVILFYPSRFPDRFTSLMERLPLLLDRIFQDPDARGIRFADNDMAFVSRVATQRHYAELCAHLSQAFPEDAALVGQLCQIHELPTDSEKLYAFMEEKSARQPDGETVPPAAVIRKVETYHEPTLSRDLISSIPQRRSKRPNFIVHLIEDDNLSRALFCTALRDHCQTILSRTGTQAMEDYAIHAPDIVFLDIGLPDISGQRLLEKILAIDPQAYTPGRWGSSALWPYPDEPYWQCRQIYPGWWRYHFSGLYKNV